MVTGIPKISVEMAREVALSQGVCIRPIVRRVLDRATGIEETVPIPCGSRRESVCAPCAHKARVIRMQQCAEGWHRTDELGPDQVPDLDDQDDEDGEEVQDPLNDEMGTGEPAPARRTRSTRRRDVVDLPRVPVEDRTIGRTFTAPDGTTYRPSMFLTLTLPSYGKVRDGVPVDPDRYDYRRAALDALHFPKLVDRLWQNLRRCAGFRVQYFAVVEPQQRLAPHLHAAIRGAIPRRTLRQVIQATYASVWWPEHEHPVYVDTVPVWDGDQYLDPATGVVLPTWDEALDELDHDDAVPAHVLRFGTQLDMRGIIAPSPEADRAVRYLTKYLTKSIAHACTDDEATSPAREAHIDRLHDQVRWLPCSPGCANWLRYGIQPKDPGPDLIPGRCRRKAHDRENLGVGGRRVLVSREWSGKTLTEHRADRAEVVREALLSAGVVAPETERMAAEVTLSDGSQRFVWSDLQVDADTYVHVVLRSVAERARWREQYQKATGNLSATGPPNPTP